MEVAGKDVWTEVQAAGILRRLGQGQASKDATFRQWLLANTSPARLLAADGTTALAGETSSSGNRFFAPNKSTAQLGWGQGGLGDYLETDYRSPLSGLAGNLSCLSVGASTLSGRECVDFVFRSDNLSGSTVSLSWADFGSYPAYVPQWDLESARTGVNDYSSQSSPYGNYELGTFSTSSLGDSGR